MSTIVAVALMQVAAAQPSVQQLFEQADAASLKAETRAEALAIYEQLDKRLSGKRTASLGLVRVRKGDVLIALNRPVEARDALLAGLRDIGTNPTTRSFRLLAMSQLAQLEEADLDFPAARESYRRLLAESTEADVASMSSARIGLARTLMFTDPAEALVHADAGLAASIKRGDKPVDVAQYHTLRGRVLLNAGRYAEATAALRESIKGNGGLSLLVSLPDVIARSDLATALLLDGKKDEARKILALTGAGRFKKGDLPIWDMGDLPACGKTVSPDDVTIVEFSIRDDGSVGYAIPIYASRGNDLGATFASAVKGLSWTPQSLVGFDPFFRMMVRMEMRCTTDIERPDAGDMIDGPAFDWMIANGATDYREIRVIGDRLIRARSEIAAAGDRNEPKLAAALLAVTRSSAADIAERKAAAARLLTLAQMNRAPPAMIALAYLSEPQEGRSYYKPSQGLIATMDRALADPAIIADAPTLSALRLMYADRLFLWRRPAQARQMIGQLIADRRVGERDPLRVGALIRLASIEQNEGQLDAARTAFAASGLDAQQCALVDAKPALRQTGAGPDAYPTEALQWNFSGWAHMEFDIGADGRTLNQRIIAAYPPFVFGKAATDIVRDARYTQSYRPGGALGCGSNRQRIRFQANN